MASDTPYSTQRALQFRGPSTSDDYNARIQENYQDLTVLYNRVRIDEAGLVEGYGRFAKDELTLVQAIQDLELRVTNLETAQGLIVFTNSTQVDNDRFIGSSFEVVAANQLTQDTLHGVLTLPQVTTSSVSKLAFVDPTTGIITIPSTLVTTVVGVDASAEGVDANPTLDTSPPELSMARNVGRIWQRNVVVGTPDDNGAQLFLYVQCPTDLFTTANSNTIIIHPFPAMGTDILEVAYTTTQAVTMTDADNYITFPIMHVNDTNAIGWVPPGSWTNDGDVDLDAGYRGYYFDPVPITGLRIKLAQRNYFAENGQYVYSYGASKIDLLYTKFLSLGTAMICFNAPAGHTISSISGVQPKIWNVLEAEIPNVFSYQVVWESAFNSGVYTQNPVPNSQRVWIEVNLTPTLGGGSPALAGLSVSYS